MKDRIIKFLAHENLTATKFADEIGVQRSSISHILSGRNNPSFEFIQKILSRYKQINADWLITGSGNMLKKNEQTDLFASPQIPLQSKIQEIKPRPEINAPSIALDYAEEDIKTKSTGKSEIIPSPKVEKIMVFYTDKTFDEFLPSR